MFVRIGDRLVNHDQITQVHFKHLVDRGYVQVKFRDGTTAALEGQQAFNLVMDLCPSALEGERGKYARHAWAIHNLLGHPLMQIFSWLGLPRLGIKIHDTTTPFPINKEQ
jgi:hypothetical protein